MSRIYWIPSSSSPYDFPPLDMALTYPDGLLAMGGDLSPERIMVAYRKGIFPWFSDDEPILWWAPTQRMVLFPELLHISRSLKKTMKKHHFTFTMNQAFSQVVEECAAAYRPEQDGTWITPEVHQAYCQLHQYGLAHSVECWEEGELVGGLYGVAIGRVFYGESMFSRVSNASKISFVYFVKQLQRWGYEMIDCQQHTDNLARFGAVEIPRQNFTSLLNTLCEQSLSHTWQCDDNFTTPSL